jgi:predicted ribosomally synthesized peptide with nif11-like leader
MTSRTDLQRFTEELDADAALAGEFCALGNDPQAWHRQAASKGYNLTLEEAGALSSSYRELSDGELEDVAGGWDGSGSGSGGTTGSGGGD